MPADLLQCPHIWAHHAAPCRTAPDIRAILSTFTCRHRELEVLIDSAQPSVHGLADTAHGLGPAEVLFDTLSSRLAGLVAVVASGTANSFIAFARRSTLPAWMAL